MTNRDEAGPALREIAFPEVVGMTRFGKTCLTVSRKTKNASLPFGKLAFYH
jgi:hypothetical protein